jgi:hypothetical protein
MKVFSQSSTSGFHNPGAYLPNKWFASCASKNLLRRITGNRSRSFISPRRSKFEVGPIVPRKGGRLRREPECYHELVRADLPSGQ